MNASADDAARDLSLEELLERARATPGLARLDWRDPIVARGLPALEAIKPWLASPELGNFAVIVIRWIGDLGHKDVALRTLQEGISTSPKNVRDRIRTAIEHLGGTVEDVVDRPLPGASLIGWYMNPQGSWHEIIDEVVRDGTRQFLSACRRWNSETWVTREGRQIVRQPQERDGGVHCDRGRFSGSSTWKATLAPLGDAGTHLFLQANVIWHVARGSDIVLTNEARSVYLTMCGRWIELNQARRIAPLPAVSPVCEDCVGFAKVDSSTAQ